MIGDGPGSQLRWLIRAASAVEELHALRRVALARGHPCRCGLLESRELSGAELDARRGDSPAGSPPPELARRLMADHDTSGATAANMVATAAVEFCRSYGVQL